VDVYTVKRFNPKKQPHNEQSRKQCIYDVDGIGQAHFTGLPGAVVGLENSLLVSFPHSRRSGLHADFSGCSVFREVLMKSET